MHNALVRTRISTFGFHIRNVQVFIGEFLDNIREAAETSCQVKYSLR